MVQNQRIPIGVMLIGFFLSIPISALTALKDDTSYDTPAGKVFTLSLSEMDAQLGRVANDMAVAYQARCNSAVSLSHLKELIHSQAGKEAADILRNSCQSVRDCAAEPASIGLTSHSRYLRLVATQQCG